jgi:hypothetical protein
MGSRPQAHTQQPHSAEIRQVYECLLAGAPVSSRHVEVDAGNRVHLLEKGAGPPVVLLHGPGTKRGSFCRCWTSSTESARSPATGPGWG